MKDIKAMREKQEREIMVAELINKIESKHPEIAQAGLELNMYESVIHGEREMRGWFNDVYPHKLCEKDVAMLLSILPANEMFPVYHGSDRKYEDEYYDMRLTRNPNQTWTMLEVNWRHDGVNFHVEFPITNESSLLAWFKESTRKLDESEISTYGIQKTRDTMNMRNNFRQLDWANGRVIHYVGAYWQQTDNAVMQSVAEHLKYQYKFAEE